ncbi:hypothetical protein [Parasitella parasitica]|uniref:Uncharacterized protein n=1 Tax=Parasitella parasitica TaxID=35722 RepID=A0A0B7N0H9_9FUNG|nr:hypothetical protein [Parasitella parasitica]
MNFDERQARLTNILETYFSDASLLWDKVMLSKMLKDPEKMVSFEELSKLPKFKSIAATAEEIRSAAEEHSISRLKLSEDKQKVGRIKPYVVDKKEELDEWSIYVEGLKKPYDNEQKFHDKNNVERAIQIVNRYNRSDEAVDDSILDESEIKSLADKLNLRVMSKMQWNDLKDKYMRLLSERKAYATKLWNEYQKEKKEQNIEQEIEEKPFTEGLIVFVDGLHPQCSKTVATALLQTSGVQIAFMNTKKKGLPSTHIRLKTPEDSIRICDYFSTHHIIQETEKDTAGKEQESKTADCLKLRLIQGTEEKIYWENDLNRK